MSRIPPKEDSQYPWYMRWIFKRQERVYGQRINPAMVWGRVPRLFFSFLFLFFAFERKSSPIAPELRALITVRVSQINWCRFCVDFNAARVLQKGDFQNKLDDLEDYKTSQHFTELEKAALEYAEMITYSDQQVSDELYERVKQHFDDNAIVDLTGLIALQNMSSKFNASLDIQPQGFCKVPIGKKPSDEAEA